VSSPVDVADQRDVDASLAGDEAAYARLIDRYQAAIASQMWRFSRDPLVVEELVQETFVEAYLSLPKFRGTAPLLHWLRRIATRVGYRHWKHTQRDRRRRAAFERAGLPETEPPEVMTPSEAGEYLHRLLERLPAEDRVVLTLHYFEQLDMNEIAEHMGWTRTLAKVRAYRARKKLRAMLEEAGYEGP